MSSHGNGHLSDASDNPEESPEDMDMDLDPLQAQSSSMTRRLAMKKDDSGISVEKLPDTDSAEVDMVENGKGKGLEKLEVSANAASSENSPDSGQQDSGCSLPDVAAENSETETDTEPDQGAQADLEDKYNYNTMILRNMLKDPRELSNALDSDDDDDTNSGGGHTNRHSYTRETPTVNADNPNRHHLEIPKPHYQWFVCKEVIQRQYGYFGNSSPDRFQSKAYGSLHMVERLELMYKMKKHEGCVNALHFNSTGTRLATGSDDLNIVIWDWTVAEPVLVYESGHRSNVFQVKFMPLGGDSLLVSSARDGQIRLAELSSTGVCKNTKKLAQHHGAAHKLALEVDCPHAFLSCAEDAVVFEVDLRESKPEKILTCKEDDRKVPLYTIHANPMNPYEFAIGGRDHFVRVYDKRKIGTDDNTLKKFCPHELLDSEIRAHITCLVYNHDGTEILASYNDEDVYTFDASHSDGATYKARFSGHRNSTTVKGINYFGANSEYIISGSDCGNIFIWDRDTGAIVQFMVGDESGVVNCLEPHPHVPILATSGLDDDVKIWVPSCETPPKLDGLRKVMDANKKDRDEERCREPEAIDGQMLWFLMHHFRRDARRRARQQGEQVEDSPPESDDSESDDSEEATHTAQCSTS